VRGGEVLDGFGVFDNPDGLIGVGDKDGTLGFPFRVTDGSAATPAFLDAVSAAGLGVLGGARFIADPTGARCALLLRRQRAERRKTATQQEGKNDPRKIGHLWRSILLSGFPGKESHRTYGGGDSRSSVSQPLQAGLTSGALTVLGLEIFLAWFPALVLGLRSGLACWAKL
jgi:hypothetical protein